MPKLALTIALIYSTILLAQCTLEKPKLSRYMTITMPKSTTVEMNNQLYTVSMTTSNVHVNTSNTNQKPCDMTIDPAKNSIKGEMKVITSNDILYVMGEHSVERIDGKDHTRYSLMMINPRDCTLKSADMSDVNVGMTPSLPRIIINDVGVDVFYPSMKTCAPCRFLNDGTKSKDITAQINPPEARNDGRIFSFDIRKMGAGYLYAQNMEGKEAMMKIIDGKSMSIVKQKQVDYPVDAMLDSKVAADVMGVCSKNHDHMLMDIVAYKEINCQRINSKLESSVKIKIPIGPHSRPVSRVSYVIDNKGEKTYIGFAENQDLRVYVYDAAGKLLKAYDMGKIDERFEKYKHRPMFYMPYTHWNVRGFIVGKEYCLVTEQVADKHEVDLHDVRCIDI